MFFHHACRLQNREALNHAASELLENTDFLLEAAKQNKHVVEFIQHDARCPYFLILLAEAYIVMSRVSGSEAKVASIELNMACRPCDVTPGHGSLWRVRSLQVDSRPSPGHTDIARFASGVGEPTERPIVTRTSPRSRGCSGHRALPIAAPQLSLFFYGEFTAPAAGVVSGNEQKHWMAKDKGWSRRTGYKHPPTPLALPKCKMNGQHNFGSNK